jgi:ribosomal protein S18 acetylase RimI-like enzyme
MESFEIAKAKQLDKIYKLYSACKEDLLKKNIYQWGEWGNNYPSKDYIKNTINDNDLYILKVNNEIVGAVVLNEKQSKEWNIINWNKINGKVLIIHALVINPKHQEKGYGKKLLLYCEQYAKDNKYSSIRLDSFKKNEISNRLYHKNGYNNLGIVIFDMKPDDNKEYYCYEKLL